MSQEPHSNLSRRERQIMDIIYRRGKASATEVMEGMPDPPSYSAVRAMLRILEEKGCLTHEQDGQTYIYSPTLDRERARESALKHLVTTFFDGSTEQAVAALLDISSGELSQAELGRLANLIEEAKKEGR